MALKVSERTIRDLCAKGRLPGAVRVGSQWRIRLEEFDAGTRRASMRPVERPEETPVEVGRRLYPPRRRG